MPESLAKLDIHLVNSPHRNTIRPVETDQDFAGASLNQHRVPVRRATELMREVLENSRDFETRLRAELGVNSTDLAALEHLLRRGQMSPSDLAKKLSISTAAVTAVVDRLSASGHATRSQHPTDRRGIVVTPSDEAVSRAMKHVVPMVAGIERALDEFDDEQQAVITRYLERVVENYSARTRDTA